MDIDTIHDKLKDTCYEGCVTLVDGKPYFRFDTGDNDPDEAWDEYCIVREDLKDVGLTLEDPYVEHDCITGDIVPLASD